MWDKQLCVIELEFDGDIAISLTNEKRPLHAFHVYFHDHEQFKIINLIKLQIKQIIKTVLN